MGGRGPPPGPPGPGGGEPEGARESGVPPLPGRGGSGRAGGGHPAREPDYGGGGQGVPVAAAPGSPVGAAGSLAARAVLSAPAPGFVAGEPRAEPGRVRGDRRRLLREEDPEREPGALGRRVPSASGLPAGGWIWNGRRGSWRAAAAWVPGFTGAPGLPPPPAPARAPTWRGGARGGPGLGPAGCAAAQLLPRGRRLAPRPLRAPVGGRRTRKVRGPGARAAVTWARPRAAAERWAPRPSAGGLQLEPLPAQRPPAPAGGLERKGEGTCWADLARARPLTTAQFSLRRGRRSPRCERGPGGARKSVSAPAEGRGLAFFAERGPGPSAGLYGSVFPCSSGLGFCGLVSASPWAQVLDGSWGMTGLPGPPAPGCGCAQNVPSVGSPFPNGTP